MHQVAPPSLDYVPGPEHPPSPDYVADLEHPPSPVDVPYVSEPEYPEYLAPSNDEAPLEDQPLPTDASPNALSPGYVADSYPEENPEEDHTDYPANGGDGQPLGYRAVGIRMRAASPPLLLPFTSHRADIPEAEMPPQKRACLTTPAPRLEIGESSTRWLGDGYGITDTWDEIVKAMLEVASTTLEGVNQRVTELATTVRQENKEFQVRLEDAQDDRAYLRTQFNTLFRYMPYHRHTAMILDREVMYARIAWTSSEDRSAAIEAHVRTLEAHVTTLIAQTSSLQTQLTTMLRRIETLKGRDPEPQDEPTEVGSSC
ncbi:hypothetical protein Tco_1406098 [Tanacetum coccineum]